MSRVLEEALNRLGDAVAALTKASVADDLTPLHNAIALRRIGMTIGATSDAPNVVVFGDLNRFKSLNDEFGHETGDAAISHIGQVIDPLLVKGMGCKGFRRSGDEFVLFTSAERIEDLRESLKPFASCRFSFNDRMHTISASFGLARADGKADFHELMERAETACQAAKSLGRGELVEWSEELASHGYRSLRERCERCGTKITCDVPNAHSTTEYKLKRCPVCESPLS